MTAGGQLDRARLILDIRKRGVTDARVLKAIEQTPRERFVEPAFERQAYDDQALPIPCGQTISQPYVVALMTAKLQAGERDKILEIGTGSGYQTAILARLCRRVYTIERHKALSEKAEARLGDIGVTNVTFLVGDGSKGWPAQAPFDRIMVTAAAVATPKLLIDQLRPNGVMVAPVGDTVVQNLYRFFKTEDGFKREDILPVRFVPLIEGP